VKVEQMMNRAVKTVILSTRWTKPRKPCGRMSAALCQLWDSEFKPIGLLTDRDICMAADTHGKPLQALIVGSTMARKIVCCRVDDDLNVAIGLMREKHMRRSARGRAGCQAGRNSYT
jgi:CBS domain-containing protein